MVVIFFWSIFIFPYDHNLHLCLQHQYEAESILPNLFYPVGFSRILEERYEKVTVSCRKIPKIIGNGSSIPVGNFSDLSIVLDRTTTPPIFFIAQYYGIENELCSSIRNIKSQLMFTYNFDLKCWNIIIMIIYWTCSNISNLLYV